MRLPGFTVLVLAAAGIASALPGRAVSTQAQGPGSPIGAGAVSGMVVDALTNAALPGAAVTLLPVGGQPRPQGPLRTTTDESGRFGVEGVPMGSLRLTASVAGYVSGAYGAQTTHDTVGRQLDVDSGDRIRDVLIRLWPVPEIEGSVSDARGEPAVGYTVRLLRRQYAGGRPVWFPWRTVQTDDRGSFAAAPIPGEYIVLLSAEPPSRNAGVTHESVFYGGGRTVETATVMTLAAGDRLSGIDLFTTFTPRPETLTVSGVFTAPESVRMNGFVALVRSGIEDPLADVEGFRTLIGPNSSGRFSFSHVLPGEYRLRFVAVPPMPPSAGASWGLRVLGKPAAVSDIAFWFADEPLSLTQSVADLEVPLRQGNRVTGRVRLEGSSDLPPPGTFDTALMHIYHAGARQLNPSVRGVPSGGVDAQGRFETVGLPPGKYVLEPSLPVGEKIYQMISLEVAGQNAFDTGLDLGTTDLTDVVVTLSSRTWELSGAVRGEDGRPLPEARVIAFPQHRARWQTAAYDTPVRVKQLAADGAGVFRITGALADTYLVAAVTSVPEFWMAPEYLETLVPLAIPVRLGLGDKQSVDLRLR